MNVKKTIATTAAAAILGVGAFSLVGVASAATSTPQVPTASGASGAAGGSGPSAGTSAGTAARGTHRHLRLRLMLGRGVVRISARTIGITPQALVAQLKTGQSIADVANAHHVDPNTVVAAIVQAGDTRIDKALANGKLTAAQGAALKARLPQFAQKAVDHHRPQGGSQPTPAVPTTTS